MEYYSPDLNSSEEFEQVLNLGVAEDRQFFLGQDPAVTEIDSNQFNAIFKDIDSQIVSFEMLTHDPIKKKVGIWPVVIMNNCSVNMSTKEFLAAAVQDDFDLVRDDQVRLYMHLNGLNEHGEPTDKDQELQDQDDPFAKNEVAKIFEEEDEDEYSDSFLDNLSEDDDLLQGKDDNLSNGSFDDLLGVNANENKKDGGSGAMVNEEKKMN